MNLSKIIFFFVFGFALTANLTAQEIKERKSAADSLLRFVKEITPEKVGESFEINDEELEQARKLIYNAYAYSPIELEKKLKEASEIWSEKVRLEGLNSTGQSLKGRLKKVKEKLAEKYGWEYVRFLESPFFMKFRVLKISPSSYKLNRRKKNGRFLHTLKIDLLVEIMEVLKGKCCYSVGEKITISYLPIQFGYEKLPDFEENKIYAAPLKYWSEAVHSNLMLKLNGLHTLYEIKNDIVYSPLVKKNPSLTWNEFKIVFKKQYLNLNKEEN